MKTMNLISTFFVAITAVLSSFCFAADNASAIKQASTEESTLSCVMSCPECSIFSRAIHESGLEDALAQAKECTIFVPTNQAFQGWSKKDLDELFSCKPAMAALVLNHVCPKSLSPEKLKELRETTLACNSEDGEKMTDKEKMAKMQECCEQMRQKMKIKHIVCSPDGKPCLGTGALCNSVQKYPDGIVKCNNGYVYTINQVQIPRGLRIYRELQNQQTGQEPGEQTGQNDPTIVVEEVEVSATAVPVENAPAATPEKPVTPEKPATPGKIDTITPAGNSTQPEKK